MIFNKKKIVFTVTNDLVYDQRMQRICTSLANNNFEVTLIGIKKKTSISLTDQPYVQKRISVFFTKTFMFYVEYNLKLFWYLLFVNTNCYCAIDLDTIAPNYFASIIKQKKRCYDAHELFTELHEVVSRKFTFKIWLWVEKFFVPKFKNGYTVNNFIANEFKNRYNSHYHIIRNLPNVYKNEVINIEQIFNKKVFIYQGAINHGRGFTQLLQAMLQVDAALHIYGEGNFINEVKQLIATYNLQNKVLLQGAKIPLELKNITPYAFCGITIFENVGLNQYYSLANRFFDYLQAGIPQICINYPEYKVINDQYNFAYPITDIEPTTIANAMNNLMAKNEVYATLKNNALVAKQILNWQQEEKKLIEIWTNIFI
jgi:Glycosyl transferases group 1